MPPAPPVAACPACGSAARAAAPAPWTQCRHCGLAWRPPGSAPAEAPRPPPPDERLARARRRAAAPARGPGARVLSVGAGGVPAEPADLAAAGGPFDRIVATDALGRVADLAASVAALAAALAPSGVLDLSEPNSSHWRARATRWSVAGGGDLRRFGPRPLVLLLERNGLRPFRRRATLSPRIRLLARRG